MTSYSNALTKPDRVGLLDTTLSHGGRLPPLTWTLHFTLFLAMMICVVLPDIVGASQRVLMVRHVAYTGYAVLMVLVGALSASRLTWANIAYLVCAVGVSMAAMATVFTLPAVRYIDYLGPASFVLGVHVFTKVLPRAFRGSAESILLPCMLILTSIVCLGYYFNAGASLEQNNTVAAYTGLTVLLLVLRGQRRGSSTSVRTLCWGGAFLLILVLAVSLGRTSIAACISTGLLLIWLGSTSKHRAVVFLILLFLCGAVLWSEVGASLFERLLSKGQGWERMQETLRTLSGRTEIWTEGLHAAGVSWLGHGRPWIMATTGKDAHSSYLTVYFAYGLLAAFFWLVMCLISLWAALKVARRSRGSALFPIAPAFVLYYLVISLTESYFNLLVGGFGMLFYIGTGMCLLETRKAAPNRHRSAFSLGV